MLPDNFDDNDELRAEVNALIATWQQEQEQTTSAPPERDGEPDSKQPKQTGAAMPTWPDGRTKYCWQFKLVEGRPITQEEVASISSASLEALPIDEAGLRSCAPWVTEILSRTPLYPDVPPLKAEREQFVAEWLTEAAKFHDTWNLPCSEAMVQGTLNDLAEMLPAKGASAEDVKKAALTCAMPQQLLSLLVARRRLAIRFNWPPKNTEGIVWNASDCRQSSGFDCRPPGEDPPPPPTSLSASKDAVPTPKMGAHSTADKALRKYKDDLSEEERQRLGVQALDSSSGALAQDPDGPNLVEKQGMIQRVIDARNAAPASSGAASSSDGGSSTAAIYITLAAALTSIVTRGLWHLTSNTLWLRMGFGIGASSDVVALTIALAGLALSHITREKTVPPVTALNAMLGLKLPANHESSGAGNPRQHPKPSAALLGKNLRLVEPYDVGDHNNLICVIQGSGVYLNAYHESLRERGCEASRLPSAVLEWLGLAPDHEVNAYVTNFFAFVWAPESLRTAAEEQSWPLSQPPPSQPPPSQPPPSQPPPSQLPPSQPPPSQPPPSQPPPSQPPPSSQQPSSHQPSSQQPSSHQPSSQQPYLQLHRGEWSGTKNATILDGGMMLRYQHNSAAGTFRGATGLVPEPYDSASIMNATLSTARQNEVSQRLGGASFLTLQAANMVSGKSRSKQTSEAGVLRAAHFEPRTPLTRRRRCPPRRALPCTVGHAPATPGPTHAPLTARRAHHGTLATRALRAAPPPYVRAHGGPRAATPRCSLCAAVRCCSAGSALAPLRASTWHVCVSPHARMQARRARGRTATRRRRPGRARSPCASSTARLARWITRR